MAERDVVAIVAFLLLAWGNLASTRLRLHLICFAANALLLVCAVAVGDWVFITLQIMMTLIQGGQYLRLCRADNGRS